MNPGKNQPRPLLSLTLLLILLTACAQLRPVELRKADKTEVQAPAGCWLLQPITYRMRHSAELKYQNRQESFEGFIEVNLKPDCRAHLVIFTALGVTLLDLEIKQDSFNFTETGKSSPGSREYRFAAAVADSVQKIFFALKTNDGPESKLSLSLSDAATSPTGLSELAGLSKKQPSGWSIRYLDYRQYPCGRLPQRIILQNHQPEFQLTLWLLKAESKKRVHYDSR